MTPFTSEQIEAAAQSLAAQLTRNAAQWPLMDESERHFYRVEAKKILEAARLAD